MKTKNSFVMLIVSSTVCLLPILLALTIYNELPARIAVHWDISGEPDNFLPKAAAVFGLPLFFMALNLISRTRMDSGPWSKNVPGAMRIFLGWLPAFMSVVLVPATLYIAMGRDVPIAFIAMVITGVALVMIGNYLPKNRRNNAVGIRLPWTLQSADNWNKTNRVAGYLFVFFGMALVVGAFIPGDKMIWAFLVTGFAFVVLIAIPALYSYLLFMKNGREKNDC